MGSQWLLSSRDCSRASDFSMPLALLHESGSNLLHESSVAPLKAEAHVVVDRSQRPMVESDDGRLTVEAHTLPIDIDHMIVEVEAWMAVE